jgi:hypothetical protein
MCHTQVWKAFFSGVPREQYVLLTHPAPGYRYPSSSLFSGTELPEKERVKVSWGGVTEVQATRALYRRALLDSDVAWVLLLSDACLPLHSLAAMRAALLVPLTQPHPPLPLDTHPWPYMDRRKSLIAACWQVTNTTTIDLFIYRHYTSSYRNVYHRTLRFETSSHRISFICPSLV